MGSLSHSEYNIFLLVKACPSQAGRREYVEVHLVLKLHNSKVVKAALGGVVFLVYDDLLSFSNNLLITLHTEDMVSNLDLTIDNTSYVYMSICKHVHCTHVLVHMYLYTCTDVLVNMYT